MKHYFVKYYGFGNAYHVGYTRCPDEDEQVEALGYERITRKEAIGLCISENARRKADPSSAYMANNVLFPICECIDEDTFHHHYRVNGYIAERYYLRYHPKVRSAEAI